MKKKFFKKMTSAILTLVMSLSAMAMLPISVLGANALAPATLVPYDAADDGDLLYQVNFHGDTAFQPDRYLGWQGDQRLGSTTDYIVSEDGSELHIQGNDNISGSTFHWWGGEIRGLEAGDDKFYTMVYQVKALDRYGESLGMNNSFSVGGWSADPDTTVIYSNYGNYNSIVREDDGSIPYGDTTLDSRRMRINIQCTGIGKKYNGSALTPIDYTYFKDLEYSIPVEDEDGYMTVMVEYDAPNNEIRSYYLADGTGEEKTDWQQVQKATFKHSTMNPDLSDDTIGYWSFCSYNIVNQSVKNVRYYKGEYVGITEIDEDDTVDIPYEPSSPEGDDVWWSFDRSTSILTIGGTGEIKDYSPDSTEDFRQYLYDAEAIFIEEGITSIGENAFYGFPFVEYISIPASVESIGNDAFLDCYYLSFIQVDPHNACFYSQEGILYDNPVTSILFVPPMVFGEVILPEGLTRIPHGAFSFCTYLTGVTIPEGVTEIEDWAFMGSTELRFVDLPDSLVSIGSEAFWCCIYMSIVNLPDNLVSIGDYAFADCMRLLTLKIPASVRSIGEYAFMDCASLQSIYVDEGNPVYHSDEHCLIETASKILIAGCKNSIIPGDGSVTEIAAGGFYGCADLNHITIPDTVTRIGEYAFAVCESLHGINLPQALAYLGDGAFFCCPSLITIVLPDTLTEIGGLTFFGCEFLGTVILPSELISIGTSAFCGCTALRSINLPATIEEIGDYAFDECPYLRTIFYENCSEEAWASVFLGETWKLPRTEIIFQEHEYDNACSAICNVCNEERMPPHNYDSSCDTVCNDCLGERTAAATHTYSDICDEICDACFEERTVTHTYLSNCDEDCNVCGKQRTAAEHTYTNACDTACDNCGKARTMPPHAYSNACDANCNICGHQRIPEEHVYELACDIDCNICGEKRAVTHQFDNECDVHCNICGVSRMISHTFDDENDTTCNVCGYEKPADAPPPVQESETTAPETTAPEATKAPETTAPETTAVPSERGCMGSLKNSYAVLALVSILGFFLIPSKKENN